MDTNYLFVYGTLRKAAGAQMHQILADYCDYYSEGSIFGQLFEINKYPGLISKNKKHKVRGEVYIINDMNKVLPAIDDYEECSDRFPEPREYVRTIKTVALPSGKSIKAWVYLYNLDVSNLEWIESGDYMAYLKKRRL